MRSGRWTAAAISIHSVAMMPPQSWLWMLFAGLSGFIGVAAGAFGAHALKSRLDAEMLGIFETGVRYQMYHTLALLGLAFLAAWRRGTLVTLAGTCFVLGILVFSGSLYVLALSGQRIWGAVTPFGGLAFLIGWLALTIHGIRAARTGAVAEDLP